jgi:hypothetical protein
VVVHAQLFLLGGAFIVLGVCNFTNTVATMREKSSRSKRALLSGSARTRPSAPAAESGTSATGDAKKQE